MIFATLSEILKKIIERKGFLMFIGFSKSVGGGFRVGVGTHINLSGKKPKKLTKAELAQAEKQEFLIDTQNSANDAISEFYLAEDILPDELNRRKLDAFSLFTDEHVIERYTHLQSLVSQIQELLNTIHQGGNLTSKRRNTLNELVANCRSCIGSSPGLRDLVKKSEARTMFARFAGFCFVMLGLYVAYLFDQQKTVPLPNELYFFTYIPGAIAVAFVVNIMVGQSCRSSFLKKAREHMKKVYKNVG